VCPIGTPSAGFERGATGGNSGVHSEGTEGVGVLETPPVSGAESENCFHTLPKARVAAEALVAPAAASASACAVAEGDVFSGSHFHQCREARGADCDSLEESPGCDLCDRRSRHLPIRDRLPLELVMKKRWLKGPPGLKIDRLGVSCASIAVATAIAFL